MGYFDEINVLDIMHYEVFHVLVILIHRDVCELFLCAYRTRVVFI